jgi:hypothetical protein
MITSIDTVATIVTNMLQNYMEHWAQRPAVLARVVVVQREPDTNTITIRFEDGASFQIRVEQSS